MTYLGIDLAWSTGTTGLAVADGTGRIRAIGAARADEQIDAWIDEHAPAPHVVGADAPLVVPNATGARPGEIALARAYGRFGATPYTSSRATLAALGDDDPRAARLARRHGWSIDPDALLGEADRAVCLEIYPHPALIALFELPYRLLYKKGPFAVRLAGFRRLLDLLESLPRLGLDDLPRWQEIRAGVEGAARHAPLDLLEDEFDAVVCAHVAWLWAHDRARLQVYGSLAEGYIVAPPAPVHAAVRS